MGSLLSLLFSNLLIVVFAALGWLTTSEVLWIYWGQSVIIGLFNIVRILDLEEFSTEGLKMNNRPVEPTRATQWKVAMFFAMHYGFFHVGYAVFLGVQNPDIPIASIGIILLNVAVFFVNHGVSFFLNRRQDRERVPNIGTIMFTPYLRILPMHIIIIAGGLLAGDSIPLLVLFVLLKTGADLLMHMVEHAKKPGKKANNEETSLETPPGTPLP